MNEFKNLYPLEFLKLKKSKVDVLSRKKNITVEIKFYQTNLVRPEAFFKPISKLINFE